ncbi:DAK2 domain-containing protein, partial [Streptomyces phytophilus]|uniref:DAK2 domain-containing protein n=1 Tax=Streptomyces phytophilus TaxID=722715 RepID=UPI0015F0D49C
MQVLDAASVRAWCVLALEALGRGREEIDAVNVFPVADGDTGTNMYLTVESAAQAVDAVYGAFAAEGAGAGGGVEPAVADVLRAMAHGALIGARGNSGTILAEL